MTISPIRCWFWRCERGRRACCRLLNSELFQNWKGTLNDLYPFHSYEVMKFGFKMGTANSPFSCFCYKLLLLCSGTNFCLLAITGMINFSFFLFSLLAWDTHGFVWLHLSTIKKRMRLGIERCVYVSVPVSSSYVRGWIFERMWNGGFKGKVMISWLLS